MWKNCFLFLFFCFFPAMALGATPAKVIVAHDATWPPMEFLNGNKVIGYSVDYIDAVAAAVGLQVEHRSVAWDGIFAELARGNYDVVSSSVTITPERERVLLFSEPYCEIRQALVVPIAENVTTLSALRGKNLGGQTGTTGLRVIQKMPNTAMMPYDEIAFALKALAEGHIDGVVCDEPVAQYALRTHSGFGNTLKVAFTLETKNPELYGFAVAKGREDLVQLLNKGIRIVKENGTEARLQKKWLQK